METREQKGNIELKMNPQETIEDKMEKEFPHDWLLRRTKEISYNSPMLSLWMEILISIWIKLPNLFYGKWHLIILFDWEQKRILGVAFHDINNLEWSQRPILISGYVIDQIH